MFYSSVLSPQGIQSARDVFLSFFEHYPYCYGYWKKLADLERKNVQEGEELAMEKCQEIFEKGLQAIPLSVDLWLQYINFTKSKLKDREDEVEQLRALYKRAIDVSCRFALLHFICLCRRCRRCRICRLLCSSTAQG